MRSRGMGYVYQPTWRDQKTRESKTGATWWISYSLHGRRHRENAHSTKEGDATKLLNCGWVRRDWNAGRSSG